MTKLQYKFVQLFLLTSVIPLVIVALISVLFLGKLAVNSAQEKITNNISISVSIYQKVSDNLKFVVRDQNRRIYSLLNDNQIDLLNNEYRTVVKKNNLAFFVVTDPGGKVIAAVNNPSLEGKDLSTDTFVKRALRGRLTVSSQDMQQDELARFGIIEQARIPGQRDTRALVIRATMPIINQNEIIIGTMTAGYLLNNNNSIVLEQIKKATGLVGSIFLGNVRICSTVPVKKGENLIGTVFSSKGIKDVIEEKKGGLTRIRVAGSWYLAGYSPILNDDKELIGMLGIGIPEKEIFALRDKFITIFSIAVLLSIVMSMFFGYVKGKAIVSSVEKLRNGIAAFGRGDYSHRIEINSGDEIEELAGYFNRTMEQLLKANQQLEVCSRNVQTLESRVSQSAAQLEAVHKQLIEYERMAAMGRMATALSHELKNVFTEIQSGAYNLRVKICKDIPDAIVLLKGMEDCLAHANSILGNVLRFSYPKKPILSDLDVNYLINDLLNMADLKEKLRSGNVKVIKELDGQLPSLKADALQIREVFLNLIENAIAAMPSGGKLNISTTKDQGLLRIKISDTGVGMSEQAMDNLFTPFFTTKSRGLGLGLPISKSIVESHGGYIQVHSEQNKGTAFIISLPVK